MHIQLQFAIKGLVVHSNSVEDLNLSIDQEMSVEELTTYIKMIPDLLANMAGIENKATAKVSQVEADSFLRGRVSELEIQLNKEQMHRRFADDQVVHLRSDLDFAKRISPEVMKALTQEV